MFRVFLALLLLAVSAAWPQLVPIATPPTAILTFPESGTNVLLGDYLTNDERRKDEWVKKPMSGAPDGTCLRCATCATMCRDATECSHPQLVLPLC